MEEQTIYIGRCMKCRENKEMKDAHKVTFTRKCGFKVDAMKGVCPICGTKMFRMLGNHKEEGEDANN